MQLKRLRFGGVVGGKEGRLHIFSAPPKQIYSLLCTQCFDAADTNLFECLNKVATVRNSQNKIKY